VESRAKACAVGWRRFFAEHDWCDVTRQDARSDEDERREQEERGERACEAPEEHPQHADDQGEEASARRTGASIAGTAGPAGEHTAASGEPASRAVFTLGRARQTLAETASSRMLADHGSDDGCAQVYSLRQSLSPPQAAMQKAWAKRGVTRSLAPQPGSRAPKSTHTEPAGHVVDPQFGTVQ
jgi:hypothetical protein